MYVAEAEDKAEIEAQAGAKAEVWLFGSEIVHFFPFFLESPSGEEVTRLRSRFLRILEPEGISDPLITSFELFCLLL